jgi:hypothetical protein
VNVFGAARADTTFGTFAGDTNVYSWSRFTF